MRKLTTTLALTAAIGAATALPAAAEHTHVRHVGQDGACVVVAPGGGESHVTLPFVTAGPTHPLHVLVHKGQPGASGAWEVQGKDTCNDDYVNRH